MKTKKEGRKNRVTTYAVLTMCLLAAGVGAWGAASGQAKNGKIGSETSMAMPSNIPTDNAAVNVPMTGIPYTEPQTDRETTEPSTQEEKKVVFPLGQFITKDYSADKVVYSNTMGDWRVHNGIDFGDNRGQSVLAVTDGEVTDVREDVLWGTVLTIDHGNGIETRYSGLEKDTTPEVGTKVEAGVIIGKLGEIPIESKDGPHLHFELIINGVHKDPLKWMAQ